MYLPAKFSGHHFYGNGDINSYINFYMNTLEEAELIALIRHIEIFLTSRILIYNSQVPNTEGRKTRIRRRTQAIAKRYVFHAYAIKNKDEMVMV